MCKDNMLPDQNREVVVQADNLGVCFPVGKRDDYKSKMIDLFKGKQVEGQAKYAWPMKHIDFQGYKGEVLGIIGSNGSGKTTLCKLISGILQPDEGSIHVAGKVTALFSLGMGFKKELTGRENVYLNGMMLGIEKDKITEYIDDIHQFSDLGNFLDQPMKYYSSGMKARLGFSVAAHMEPEVLILDEALNTGDREFSQKAAQKMRELVQKAKMVILVTHSLKYAKRNCDRLIWLDKGVIRGIGDPAEIIKQYKLSIPARKRRKKEKLELEKTVSRIQDQAIVKADNVAVSFELNKQPFWALRNISFEIKEGEVVGIIGHNGAGKSTLTKVLTGILRPEEGTLQLNGETTSLLSYGAGFNEQLTGTDNIYLNGMLLGIDQAKVEKDFPEIVQFSGLEKSIDKPVKNYSSGMKARLGFSIAATLQPDIFIIDEALSTGDIAFQQKASERIQEMMEQAKAVIIVTHSMTLTKQLCTRAIWMEKGQIRFDGDPEQAVEFYQESIKKKRETVQNKG
ncbi:ABC transporter ATP-binding protein [Alkalihalobacillus hemicellulosilyticus]|uniref:Teichoic acid export ATP-binding protein TagH n=1 Tax=Halalkalibacter hemicellulosilyticusJCM 9152 TaxID=1236971 RepID=W4QH77_9BACI|nr:ATP-binding cassette domain-containing protein [Halalkalibacter hemicellulosilyticus]GAE31450.1 teichoic acid export ATP-binding protein TagH [Halalkalibacter hemicellulosilyticusJCM 9152]